MEADQSREEILAALRAHPSEALAVNVAQWLLLASMLIFFAGFWPKYRRFRLRLLGAIGMAVTLGVILTMLMKLFPDW